MSVKPAALRLRPRHVTGCLRWTGNFVLIHRVSVKMKRKVALLRNTTGATRHVCRRAPAEPYTPDGPPLIQAEPTASWSPVLASIQGLNERV